MTRTIVCYGDSNTHGADPIDGTRHPRDVRWPGVLRTALGEGYEIIEEGLGGRTTVFDSPLAPARNGRDNLSYRFALGKDTVTDSDTNSFEVVKP